MDTKISWTNKTWNPTTGCSKVSEGCRFCYAEALAKRWQKETFKEWTAKNAPDNVKLHPERLRKPYSWKTPRRVFVNSMSDLFHEQIPFGFIDQVFDVMLDTPQHQYQILTKRPERMQKYMEKYDCDVLPENIWLGTSIEERRSLHRLVPLRKTNAHIRFLSLEPLLEPLGTIDLTGISWVIVGGESGPNHRPMDHAWAREIRGQCVDAGVAFFFKQSSAFKTETGTALIEEDGTKSIWNQYPDEETNQQLVIPHVFDGFYGLDEDAQSFLLEKEKRVKSRQKNMVLEVIENGLDLLEVKAMLPHGLFGNWIRERFGWSPKQAARLMNAALNFNQICQIDKFQPSALYALSEPNVPEAARQEALNRAEKEEPITHKTAKEIIAKHKPPPEKKDFVTVRLKIPAEAKEAVEAYLTSLREAYPTDLEIIEAVYNQLEK